MSKVGPRCSGPSFANPWVILGLAIQTGAAVASTYGFLPLLFPIAFLTGLSCLIGGGDWAIRGRPVGTVLVAIGIGSPAFMLWYPHHLGHFVREHMAEYRAAVPVVLAAGATHCEDARTRIPEWCEVRDRLPRELRSLGRDISIKYSDEQPVVFFRLLVDRRGSVVYAPGWPDEPRPGSPFRSLGGGWRTTLPE